MRRLPVYFLLDTSGSMYGEPIQALNNALSGMVNTLRMDAQALDSLWLSIITFDREVKELMPLTELVSFQLPEITCPQSGPTHTGMGLELLYAKVNSEVRKGTPTQKGDWRPLLFLFTDGKPSDVQLYREMIPRVKSLNFAAIVGCAAGKMADNDMLKELTDTVVHLDTADSATLKQFFKWVSDTIEQGNKSMGTTEEVTLPAPPQEVNLVI
ncbi:vWA domain-containing protein [Chitinophaga nivalis]|uniref:VWA domain-containing protein n=1 Tax=Chitinophaga nivalis TaxID=2991709 RepID=A0ABT3IJ55_9BACT|nr:VWA domain-containing protein [Chitinophaga nivalis]MCW3466317.1 VWA domain-containing protein [Chitinophaga nivalis]MCW3483992.1 VWA domain-containing protein [Chitinophaga nivalis]